MAKVTLRTQSGIPTGITQILSGSTVPFGFLLCDGSQVSRSTYAALFASIGVTHGSGNGTTTFHLPDYRGRFLRGVDGAANLDPDKATRAAANTGGNTGNNVGSIQNDDVIAHTHSLTFHQDSGGGGAPNNNVHGSATINPIVKTTTSFGGSAETRPKNASVNYIISY